MLKRLLTLQQSSYRLLALQQSYFMHYQSSAKKLFYALSVISDFNKQNVLTVNNELQPSSLSIYR